MIPATEGVFLLQIKSKSSIPWTARGCRPLGKLLAIAEDWDFNPRNSLNETSCLVAEEHMVRLWTQWSAGGPETSDVVVGISRVGPINLRH